MAKAAHVGRHCQLQHAGNSLTFGTHTILGPCLKFRRIDRLLGEQQGFFDQSFSKGACQGFYPLARSKLNKLSACSEGCFNYSTGAVSQNRRTVKLGKMRRAQLGVRNNLNN